MLTLILIDEFIANQRHPLCLPPYWFSGNIFCDEKETVRYQYPSLFQYRF